jgi:hypothetical protein
MKQFIKSSPRFSVIEKPASAKSGNFEIVKVDHINKNPLTPDASPYSVVNPERIQGTILHFNENAGGVQRLKSIAKKRAEIIAEDLNKSDSQRKIENLAPELLDLILDIAADFNFPDGGASRKAQIKKRISDVLSKAPSDFKQLIEQ